MRTATKKTSPTTRGPRSKEPRLKGSNPGQKGNSFSKDVVWKDDYDFEYTMQEMIEEIVFLRKIKTAYEDLMFRFKVPAKDIANVTNKTKYGNLDYSNGGKVSVAVKDIVKSKKVQKQVKEVKKIKKRADVVE
jgi:hypothetical protein